MLVSRPETKDPQLLGEEYHLGEWRITYPPMVSSSQFIIFGALLVGSILLLIIVEYVFMLPVKGISEGLPFILIFLPVCLWFAYHNWSKCIHVYSDGLIYVRRASLQVIHWQDVEAVRHRAYHDMKNSFDRYILDCQNGEKLKIGDSFCNVRQLGETIEIETAHHLIPIVWDIYRKQHKITFGPLTLTPEGIIHEGKMLSWKKVNYIGVDNWSGCIKVRAYGKRLPWCVVRLGKVPNIQVFRIIVLRITVEVLRRKITI